MIEPLVSAAFSVFSNKGGCDLNRLVRDAPKLQVHFLWLGLYHSPFAFDWHSLFCPALSGGRRLSQKLSDFFPAFQQLRFGFLHLFLNSYLIGAGSFLACSRT